MQFSLGEPCNLGSHFYIIFISQNIQFNLYLFYLHLEVSEVDDNLKTAEDLAYEVEMEGLKYVEELIDRCVAVGILSKVSMARF